MVHSPHNVKEMYVPSIDRAKYKLVYARPSIMAQWALLKVPGVECFSL